MQIRPHARIRRGLCVRSLLLLLAAWSSVAYAQNPCGPPIVNPIACENTKPGNPSSQWDLASPPGDPNIQGYSTDISYNLGDTAQFKVNSTATSYRIDIYRIGYYQGNGARLVAQVNPTAVLPQIQPACVTDPSTNLIDCGTWAVSASWTIPTTAVTGVYIAKLVGTDGVTGSSHIIFVVRDDSSHSDMLFQTSDTGWQAYNAYGGISLYQGNPRYKVSYNRPITVRGQTNSFLTLCCSFFSGEYPMVRFLESNGYNVSYFTDMDSDRRGSLILNHKMWMSVGHDEYWSGQQRANVEAARAAGVHLGFFSGNEIYEKTRWEPSIDGSNTPYRTLVCYKQSNGPHDPLDPPIWTGEWRDTRTSPPADARPENGLSGTIFMVTGTRTDAMEVPDTDGKMRFWRNTSIATLAPGATAVLQSGTLGYEWDEDLDNGSRPAGIVHLSTATYDVSGYLVTPPGSVSPVQDGSATHHMTLYRYPSGSLVFSSGSVQYTWGLDSNHDWTPATVADPNMQQATVNLFADMGIQPYALIPGLTPATQSTDTTPPQSAITYPAYGANLIFNSTVPITITGVASDVGGGLVGGVDVSTDGGVTWHPAQGRSSWSYTWQPTTIGAFTILSRAVDDSANIENPGTGITVTLSASGVPLVISSVGTSAIAVATATVNWTTAVPSSSLVSYGATSNYGQSVFSSALVTQHSVTLTGLAASTTYHFRVSSTDASANVGVSTDLTFSTLAPSTVVPPTGLLLWLRADQGVVTTGSSVSVWADQSVNATNATQLTAGIQPTLVPNVINGQPVVRFNGTNNYMSFFLPIANWTGATMILVTANSPNVVGGVNGSDDAPLFWDETAGWGSSNFSPFQQIVSYRFGTTQSNNLPVYTRPRSIGSAPSLTTMLKNGVNEYLYVNGGLVYSQGGKLAAISGTSSTGWLGAGYHTQTYFAGDIAEVLVYNAALSNSDRQQVEQYLLAKYGISQTPVISGLGVSNITGTSATINWTTDKASDSQVSYGLTNAYGTSSPLAGAAVTTHSVVLTGLTTGNTYHYQAQSGDAFGNVAFSGDFTFVTGAAAPPVVSNGSPSGTLPGGTTSTALSVSTNVAATCAYSTTDVVYASMTAFTSTGGVSHSTTVTGLANGQSYTYYVRCSASGNADTNSLMISFSVSQVQLVATPTISPNGGSSNSAFTNVTLTDATAGASIYYTTNGNPPTTGSTPYTVPFSITSTATVQAIGVKTGLTNSSVASALFTVRTTPPVRSNGAPSGTLVAGTTSAVLSLTTDEAATCAYATSDVAYASMAAFNTTGGLTHTTPITGLANGQTYAYYVRCLDAVGNVNTNSLVISFSIAQAPAAPPMISPGGGFSITPVTVTLTDTTPGASIYYTTDNTTPTTGSTLYTQPFIVGVTSTVQAIAAAPNMINSTLASATFTLNTAVPGSGLQLWLKADSGVVQHASLVSQWTDQSPNGVNATQTYSTSQPTFVSNSLNGQPVVRFDGVSSFMNFTLPINGWTGATVILVTANSPNTDGNWNGSDSAPLFWNETTSWGASNFSPFQQYVKYRFGTTQGNNIPAYTRPRSIGSSATLTTAIKNGTNEFLYVDGGLVLTQTGKLAAIKGDVNTGWLGTGYDNLTFFGGDIAEIFVYNQPLTDAQRQPLEQYLLAKYGIAQTPVISGVGVSNITGPGATVNWTTDHASDSQVNYGPTNSYGNTSTLAPAAGNTHSVPLTGLTSGATYHYQVLSADAFGNLATSGDFTFVATRTVPPVISNGAPTGALASTTTATLSVSTDEAATCAYSTSDVAYASMTHFTTTGGLAHSTNVSGLANNTSYTYYVRCTDALNHVDTSSYVISFSVGTLSVVATPSISPNGGSSNTSFSVTLSTTTAGASIYYTTNNTPPTTGSTPYGGQFSVTSTSTVQAMATAPSMTNSAVASATFTIRTTPPVRSNGAPTGSLAAGTTSTTLALSTDETATCAYSTTDVAYASMTPFTTTGGLAHSTTVSGLTNGSSYTYYVRCVDTFTNVNTNSYVISFSVGTVSAVATPSISPNGGSSNTSFSVSLSTTTAGASIYYTTNNTPPTTGSTLYGGQFSVTSTSTVQAMATAPSMTNSAVSTATFTIRSTPPVRSNGAPAGSLAAGTTSTTLSLSTDETATCAYSTSDTAYASMTPFTTTGGLAHSTTVSGLTNGTSYTYYVRCVDTFTNVNTNSYAISFSVAQPSVVATPSISPNGGSSNTSFTVTLSTTTPGASIYYTTNNTTPSTSSTPYGGQFSVTSTSTVQAIATAPSLTNSAVASATFTIRTTPPVRSNGTPTGPLAAGTTSTTLSLSTDETATCAYSTSDVAYASMTPFITTGGLAHSTTVSGLTNGTSYTYYVRCVDTFTNVNTNSYAISFSVAQPSVVATPSISPNGGSSNTSFTVTLSTTTTGASIYYTTNNTPPSTSSTPYGGQFIVSATSTVQAIAAKAGSTSSAVATATFTISTAPAVLSNGAPSGTLASGTTSTTLSLSTNEAATCAYSTSDVAYASMTALTTTGGLSHSTALTGLTNGQSYAYYVRCLDAFGNVNTSSYLISFSVAIPYTTWYSGGWSYRKSITINNASIASALSNFPVLISVTDPDLSANATSSGGDILFTLGDGLTKLNHEVESYVPGTGTLNAWVKVPTLTPGINTTIYMYFGNPGASSQANPSGTWDPSFNGVWHLSQNPATNPQFADSTSHGNTGVVGYYPFTAASLTPGIAGGGLTFNGTNQYVQVPDSASLDSGSGITISTWVKTSTWNFNVNVISKGSGCINNGFVIWLNEGEKGTGMPSFWNGGWVDGQGANVSDGNWHLVTTTYDGTTASVYVDGVLKASGARQNVFNTNTALTLAFGQCGNYFAGTLDEMRVSGVARSAAWIAAEFANGSAPQTFTAEGPIQLVSGASPAVATPMISPNGGSSNAAFNVSLSTTTAGASIYYTTDNTTPTTSSTPYGGSFSVGATSTVQAIAAKTGYTSSGIATATFTVNNVPAVLSNGAPSGTLASGTTLTTLSLSTNEAATCAYSTSDVAYASMTAFTTTGGMSHSTSLTGLANSQSYTYYARCKDTFGNINPSSFVISFSVASPPVVVTPTISPNGGSSNAAFSVTLSTTTPGASIYYTTNNTTPTTSSTPYGGQFSVSATSTVQAMAAEAGYTSSGIATATFTISTTPAVLSGGAPSGTQPSGTTSTTLSLSTNEAATCAYSTSDVAYASMTAFASTGGLSHSTLVAGLTNGQSYTYYVRCKDTFGNVNPSPFVISFSVAQPTVVATPMISPNGGSSNAAFTVTLSTTTPGATIYYTTNNTPPSTSSTPYGGQFSVSSTSSVQAMAAETGYTSSGVATATFTISTVPAVLSAGSPSGTLPSGTTSTTLSVSTNEAATCAYSTSDVAYTSMTAFTTTGGMSHSTSLTGLTNSQSYTYYARCKDTFGNINPSSFVISFSVASPPVVATPSISPNGGSSNAAFSVTLSTTTPGATIYYTTNNTPPSTSSTPYGGQFSVTTTSTVQAIAAETGYTSSGVATATFTISTVPAVLSNGAPSGTLASGTTSTTLSVSTNEAATCAYSTSDVAYASMTAFTTTGGMSHSTSLTGLANSQSYTYYARCKDTFGNINPSSFVISFSVASPPVVATPSISPNGGSSNAAFSVTLSTTTPGATIYYTTNNTPPSTSSTPYGGQFSVTTTSTVQAIAAETGYTSSGVATATFTISTVPAVLSAGAPSGTLPSGTTSATLSLSTNEAATCAYSTSDVAYASMTAFTTTGGLAHSTALTGLANSQSYTYYARCKDTFGNINPSSFVISFSVASPPVAATPTISPNGGASNAAFSVTLSTTTPGATIYYTTNNTTPSTSSTPYGGTSFSVSATSIVQAMAAKTGYTSSGVATATFTISTVPAVLSGGSPAGTLPTGTTSATLSLSTNEAATCAYSTSNVAYASMTALTTTGGLAHSTPLTGLTSGQSYTYYVRCLDIFGNVNTSSYSISFSVAFPWYSTSWTYRKSISINGANIAGALSNFPVLISVTDTDLSAKAAPSGADILFTLSDGVTKLNHQVESFNPATGALSAWVNVPSLSQGTNATIYMYFGNPGAPSQANPAGAWDPTFAGVWHLNENPSTTTQFADSTGHGNTGVAGYFPFTAASQNPGIAGGGLTFNGSNQYIKIPDAPGLDSGVGLTVSTWVKTTSGNFNVNLINKGTGCISTGFVIWLNEGEKGTGMPSFWVGSWLDGQGANVADGKWHQVTTTYDGTTSKVYVDGVLKASTPKQGGFNTNASLTFGYGSCGNYLTGSLDEVRVSGVARSAAWVSTEFANQSAPQTFLAEGALQIY